MQYRIEAEGLKEFRRDLRRAADASPREMTAAMRAAGQPPLRRVRELSAKRTGRFAAGWRLSVSGAVGSLTNRVEYAGGAVWGKAGRWRGFQKYGLPPRFAGPAIEQTAGEIEAALTKGLTNILTIHGWFRG